MINETEVLEKFIPKYYEATFSVIVLVMGVCLVLVLLAELYFQLKYSHALRTISVICEAKSVTDEELAIFVKRAKDLPSNKLRAYFE